MFTPTYETAQTVLSVVVGIVLGLTTALILHLTMAKHRDDLVLSLRDDSVPSLVSVLYGFAVILLLGALASPIRLDIFWLISMALLGLMTGYYVTRYFPTSGSVVGHGEERGHAHGVERSH